ncbi:hypothetical protein H9X96_09275 [Pedobacter sp. N36a]|uniref:hypothetical protein n=1 Tax=Pedobacter sp. N36a TaxID=2767996 RepID=UPI0016571A53|nr:hypothetical protein [Pedobacter sp. N36a]MBC8985968.1 hypothetical protein [Pedobacter sp. N36a]
MSIFAPMKRVMIYFLVTCILSGSAITELFKGPILVSHYIDHTSRNPNINFIDFLSMHYWGKDIVDNDGNQDSKLPFKKILYGHHQLLFCQEPFFELSSDQSCIPNELCFFYWKKEIYRFSGKPYKPPQAAFLV